MEMTSPLLRTQTFTVTTCGTGRHRTVEVRDASRTLLATGDTEGTLYGRHGRVLEAPLRWRGNGCRATDATVEVSDEYGRPLGTGRVVAYGFGPSGRKVTVAMSDPAGRDVARLEPQDRSGRQLVVRAADGEVATVSVTQERTGLLRRSRAYAVRIHDAATAELRPIVLALAVRYDALLNAAQAVEQPD